ncbi:MAG: acyl-homoserine-lactone synthase [Ktedonobacterales bacterium]
MDVVDGRLSLAEVTDDGGDVVYSQAGIALPRQARQQPRAMGERSQRTAGEPVRYSVRAFTARTATQVNATQATLEEAYRLRARVFMRELGWLTPSADGREYDRCDPLARHFAVFAHAPDAARQSLQDAPLIGYARVLLPRQGFMLQHEFVELMPEHTGRPLPDARHAFEVSRFVVHPLHRGRRCVEGYTATDHLARAIAQWALADGRTDWWTVCEARHLRALRLRGLRFTQVGRIVEYQPGIEACAALLRLPVAADELRQRRADDYAWYAQGRPPEGGA